MKVEDKEKLNDPTKGWQIVSAISSMVFHTVQWTNMCHEKHLYSKNKVTGTAFLWQVPWGRHRGSGGNQQMEMIKQGLGKITCQSKWFIWAAVQNIALVNKKSPASFIRLKNCWYRCSICKLDGVAPLITDPQPTSCTTYSKKESIYLK